MVKAAVLSLTDIQVDMLITAIHKAERRLTEPLEAVAAMIETANRDRLY